MNGNITKETFDEKLLNISKSLEPCPLCKGKADIIGVHNTTCSIIIDAVVCLRCNLILEREKNWLLEPKKLFSNRHKNIVDVVQTWNSRAINKELSG